jgi:hypothetical protein
MEIKNGIVGVSISALLSILLIVLLVGYAGFDIGRYKPCPACNGWGHIERK